MYLSFQGESDGSIFDTTLVDRSSPQYCGETYLSLTSAVIVMPAELLILMTL
jgi:hypothetical protein